MSFDLSIFNFTDTVLDTSSEASQVDNHIFKDQKLDEYIDDNITGTDSEKVDKLEDLFEICILQCTASYITAKLFFRVGYCLT
jgi:hypothetical protein